MLWLTEKLLDQPVKNNVRTYNNTSKIAPDQGHDCTTGCLLDYYYFNKNYKMIAIDLSKQQALDADSKAIQQVNFTGSLDWHENAKIFFIIEKEKETILYFPWEGIVNVFYNLFCFNIISLQNNSV